VEKRGLILIVDDDELVLNSLAREIKGEGYQVLSADNAKSALQLLKDQSADVVISDHKMPGVQGLSLLRIIKDHYPDIVRIMLTGYADLEAALTAINDIEVFRFYVKPWNRVDLLNGIGDAMRLRSFRVESKKLFKSMSDQLARLKALNPDFTKD
jgi:two-component system probable response regulator PhcQ